MSQYQRLTFDLCKIKKNLRVHCARSAPIIGYLAATPDCTARRMNASCEDDWLPCTNVFSNSREISDFEGVLVYMTLNY